MKWAIFIVLALAFLTACALIGRKKRKDALPDADWRLDEECVAMPGDTLQQRCEQQAARSGGFL